MGLLMNPVIQGLLSGGPNAIRAQAEAQRASMAPRGGGGMMGAPSPIVTQDRSLSELGQGLAGLGQGLGAIGQMREKAKRDEAFEAAISKLPPEMQAAARLSPDAAVAAMLRAKGEMKPVPLSPGQVLVHPQTGERIAAGPAKSDDIDLKGSAETGLYTVERGPDGKPAVTMHVPPRGPQMTSLQNDFMFARKGGFAGSFIDYVKQTRENTVEKAPTGYKLLPDGSAAPIPGGPADPNAPTTAPVAAAATPTGARVGDLGVPAADTDPTAGLPAEQRAKLAAKIREEAIKEFAKSQESVDQARNINERLSRFVQLLDEGMDTGGQYKIPGAKTVGSTLSPSIAEAQSIVDMMTPMMRQGMPGAASDRDVAMFRGAAVGLDKPEQANRNVAAGLMASRQNLIERDQFMRAYFDQNRHLQGADRAWQKYLDANPIFDHAAPKGAYILNEKRAGWRDWYSGAESNPAAATTATTSNIPAPPFGFVVSP